VTSPIDQLESDLWIECVLQSLAEDDATIERWTNNEVVHIKERFIINPMPARMEPLLNQAEVQWKKIEYLVLTKLGQTRDQFLKEFELAREHYISGSKEWEGYAIKMLCLSGAVRNIAWVNLFSWIVPAAICTNIGKYRDIGRMVTAIFYSEQLSKHLSHPSEESIDILRRLEARWFLVNQ
jgi:hypothetical protein